MEYLKAVCDDHRKWFAGEMIVSKSHAERFDQALCQSQQSPITADMFDEDEASSRSKHAVCLA